MNVLDKKQLNLLLHLARVDGKFEKSERQLLAAFIKKKRLEGTTMGKPQPVHLDDFSELENKIELLHWALLVMHADKVVHPEEILFCENLARALGFNPEAIKYYVDNQVPELEKFENEVKQSWTEIH